MAKTYYTVLTTYGSQLFAQAMANRQPVRITQFAVGDGNGRAVQPDSARTSLVRQVHRANISAVSPDPRNNKQVIFELTIPENVGGFWIREMGIYDANNRLVAYANCPDTYKPQLSEGSGKVQVMRMILLVSSSQAVTLTVDDTVIFATRGQLTPKTITATSQNGVDDTGHSHAIDHATTGQKGIVQLTNDTGLDSEALALTAKAGKKLAQEIAQNRQKTVDLANQKINKSDVSDAVNSTSQTTVASSRAVKTAYDLAASKQSPATTLAGYGITDFVVRYLGDDDLNDVTVPGMYGQNLNAKSKLIKNYPIERAGSLVVMLSGNGVQQEYTTYYGGLKYVRGRMGNGNWERWIRIDGADWDNIRNKVNASTEIYGLAKYSDAIDLDSSEFSATPKAVKLLNDKKQDKLVQQTLDLTSLDPDKWYPVVLKMVDVRKLYRFAVRRTLGDGNNPTWATHGAGFSTYCEWETQPSQWGAYPYIDSMRLIRQFTYAYCHQSPMLKIGQIYQASWEYIYLRGGTSYTLSRESDVIVDIGVSGYTWQHSPYSANLPIIESYDDSLVPKTSRQAIKDSINDEMVGQVAYFASSTPPTGWLKANGAAVSRTTYAALFARIGIRFGAGDGSTTFNLPDLRGEFVRGWDDGRNIDAGRALGSHQGDAIRNITGEIWSGIEEGQGDGAGALRVKSFGRRGGSGSHADHGFTFDASRVVPTAHENRPRNIAMLACIKY